MFDELSEACYNTNEALTPIAYVFAFAGLLVKAFGAGMGDLAGAFRQILMICVVAVLLNKFPEIIIGAQGLFGVELLEELDMDPLSIVEDYFESYTEIYKEPFTVDFSSPTSFFGSIDPTELINKYFEAIGSFIMFLFGIFAYILIVFAYLVQVLVLYIGLAAAPIFIGMLMWQSTKETGIKYITGLFGITLWPLGWGLGLIFLDAIVNNAEFAAFAVASPFIGVDVALILLLVGIVWVIVTVFYAPKLVSKAITAGTQIGTGMVGETIGMATATAGAAVTAAAAVGGAAAGAAATVATGGAAAPAAAAAIGAGGAAAAAGGAAAGGAISAAGGAARPDN